MITMCYAHLIICARPKYELLFMNTFEKGICAVNRIYIPNHYSLELQVLGNYFSLDGINAGTISTEG